METKTTRLRFTTESMFDIMQQLSRMLQDQERVTIEVLNPDLFSGSYAGKIVHVKSSCYLYHSLRTWQDLALALQTRMLVPLVSTPSTITLTFEKLQSHSFHTDKSEERSEKYGIHSAFADINKNEEPAFLTAYVHALKLANIETRQKVLNLGVNRGDEFALIKMLLGEENFHKKAFVGVDYAQSAIAHAKSTFPFENIHFYQHDINTLDRLKLGKFDLIISIGTLQSPGINYKPLLMKLIQEYLSEDGAIILGFPNSRWIDGEMVYGAKMRNFRESDLSLVLSDIDFAKRYLQQKKFTVRISGKEYIFLTATRS